MRETAGTNHLCFLIVRFAEGKFKNGLTIFPSSLSIENLDLQDSKMRRSPKSKMAPSLILAKEREQNGLALRKAGFTYAEIGKKLGITEMGAYEAVKRALAHLSEKIVEDAEMFRRLELERLDALQNVFWKPALKGNLRATETILSIMRRRADLMGLDRKYTAEPRESSERATEVKVVFQDGRGVEYPFEKIFPKNQAEPAK